MIEGGGRKAAKPQALGDALPEPWPPTSDPFAMKLRTVTLGCKVNQYETEYVREALLGIGYEDAAAGEPAELCVVNTCTVTVEGEAKSRRAIRRLARENPGAKIVVMGCYATRAPAEVAALPGVSEVVTDKRRLPELVRSLGVADVPTGISGFGGRHRAYVKVQDGCLLRCSFCIIPHVRPRLTSRPVEYILDEVRRLTDRGYRELVLTGIHLGHYGIDWNRNEPKGRWVRLSDLVRRIAELPGDFRVRLSSIEATEVTRELVDVLADYGDKVAPHLHISMQSGSDTALRRMRRRSGIRRFVDRCRLVQDRLDRPAITTDVIVGFPGETGAEFAETIAAAREVGFSKMHVFPFSPRPGTLAATMPDQVPAEIKHERCRGLAAVEAELRDAYYRSLCGRRLRLRVLVENKAEGGGRKAEGPDKRLSPFPLPPSPLPWLGTSCRYATVELPATAADEGRFRDVVAGDVRDGRIIAAACLSGGC
jgi:threonylcarbamoyladenosine tRNA methylthiotransferase MtaB